VELFSPYQLRKAEPNDMDQIIGLINTVQPHLPFTPEQYHWQYINPPGGKALLYLIFDGERVVSLYAAIAQNFLVNGKHYTARHVQDVMTHPDYRGKGFLHTCATACYEEISRSGAIGYTFPNELSGKSFRRSGWLELCPVPARIRETAPSRVNSELCRQIHLFGGEFNELYLQSSQLVGIQRDCGFMNWRSSKPENSYQRWMIADGAGMMVTKLYPQDQPQRIHLVELVVKQSAEPLIPDLLDFVSDFGQRNGAGLMTAFLTEGHRWAGYFDQNGLTLSPPNRLIFYIPQTGTEGLLSDPGNWTLMHGDHDIV
jgi:GNAT superfamily N-acetyltransferase